MVLFKNRYMVIEVAINVIKDSSGNEPIIVTEYNLLKAIKDSILFDFGECGLALSLGSLQVKYVNPSTKLCIVRTSREDHQKIWSAMTMVTSIAKCPVTITLLHLSGTIKACKNAALKCEEAKFEQYKLEAGPRLTPEKSLEIRSFIEKINALEN
ncbi:putative ribonuclease P/MRP protein subunit POP5 [Apostasia shenzhenica]|uniref:Putative ribonuclease P/MRP protein subunit POP5 n=1 Tax=Apostasia shenzhenica TaxID=1088818 RepID=A0A2I0AJP4_9ASPA|nr:putative ribonuclease P/MRP protein subunit POP5 [Apostasia shenzhenica]